jgi:hypothetical protein
VPVAYRSVFSIAGDQNSVEDIVLEQFNEWLLRDPITKPRGLNRDLYKLNSVTVFNPATELIYFEYQSNDGSRTLRARLIENKGEDGRWISTLTLHFPKKRPHETVVMYEGDAPYVVDEYGNRRAEWVGTPGLVRRVLDVAVALDVVDPEIEIFVKPKVIDTEDECESLFDILCDPERSICIIVVACKKDENPITKVNFLESLLKGTLGTASCYVLSYQATRKLNALVGNSHSIFYNNLRVFVPEFDPAVELNARLHPIVKMNSVNKDNRDRHAKYLGHITRKHLLDKPLKSIRRDLSRAIENLNAKEYEVLLSGSKIIERQKPALNVSKVEEALPIQIAAQLHKYEELKQILGIEELSETNIQEFSQKIIMHDLLIERLSITGETLKDLELEIFELREERDDAILLSAEASIEVNKLQGKVRWLQKELSSTNHAGNIWGETPEDEIQFSPANFAELLENLHRLPNLVFTGNPEIALDLDRTELGARSANAWNELCGLNDYCEAKRKNLVNGGIKQFIDSLPTGFRTISNFRAKESESVERNTSLRNQRLFEVPRDVDVTGRVYMFSHCTIGKRLHIHFYDDFSQTGKIYIGRIGNHLDTASTN